MGRRSPAAAARLLAAAALATGLTAWIVARPLLYQVEGVSMSPGLMPGDVVATSAFPRVAGLRGPRRFERWLLTPPGGGDAIKRVVGLPGETISIVDGDLAVDGRLVVTPPRILAETSAAVPTAPEGVPPSATARCRRTVTARVVLDDVDFAPGERRLLLPVRDVGLAATVRVHGDPAAPPRLRAQVGGFIVTWRLPSAGACAAVAGRLDGHLVAACWQVSAADCRRGDPRGRLPPGIPADWQVVRPWPAAAAEPGDPRAATVGLWVGGGATSGSDDEGSDCDPRSGEIVSFVLWRDVFHRPAADGRDEWRLGRDEFLLLGDFPSGSLDSRHWGPLRRGALRASVTGPR